MGTISFSKKFGFIAQNFDFYPLKTFFYPLNTCQCKLKSVPYFTVGNYNNRLKNCIKTRSFYKNWVLQLKIAILPPETIFFPWNHSKNFQNGKFCWIEVVYNVLCVVGILGCYQDYSVKIMSKNSIFCWFFLYFHLHYTPRKKVNIFFRK